MIKSRNENCSFFEVGRNCIFIFKEAFSTCKFFFTIYILLMAIVNAIDSVLAIMIYKYLIDAVGKDVYFGDIVYVLLIYGGCCGLFTISVKAILEKIYDSKILQVNEKINVKMFEKSRTMDLINFDNEGFYDKYVRAMENSEIQTSAAIKAGSGIASMGLSIISLSGILLKIDSAMFLFPLLACMVHLFANLNITRIKYELQKDITPSIRKKMYCKRVFYQPEYAKEMRLTDIYEAHVNFFKKSTEDEIAYERKYGLRLKLVKMINCIFGWVVLVYYLPMQYLVYNSVVTTKLLISDVAAMNESNQSLINSIDNFTTNMVGLQEIGLFGGYYKEFLESVNKIETRKGILVDRKKPKVIELKNVSFSYDGQSDYVLKNINMKIEPGQKIAIVGYNGSGKSTLLKLLLNLYSATEGTILYDGIPIEEYDCMSYRNNFSVLFQDFQTYALSIKDNVIMGSNNCHNEIEALDCAKIRKKVEALPYGDKSVLTKEFDENGIAFSGGENQKIALSRLFSRDASIILLDEHTSAMDPMTEKEVNNSIFTWFCEQTIIYISHHLTSIYNADYIYLLEKGRIIESGTHEELMKSSKKYRVMYDKQTSYYTA